MTVNIVTHATAKYLVEENSEMNNRVHLRDAKGPFLREGDVALLSETK